MKITDNSTTENVHFSTINKGCVFKFANMVFMKTEDVIDKVLELPSNAVNLDDGTVVLFASNTTVTVVDCELIIK